MRQFSFELKKCPKCGRIMMDDWVLSGRKWQVVWHCLCGHTETEEGNGKQS